MKKQRLPIGTSDFKEIPNVYFFWFAWFLCFFEICMVLAKPLQADELKKNDIKKPLRFEHISTEHGLSYPNVYGIF